MIKHICFCALMKALMEMIKNKCKNLWRKASCHSEKVNGLLKVEVGFDFSNEKDSSDVVLYSEFENKEALHQYQIHPDHEDLKMA